MGRSYRERGERYPKSSGGSDEDDGEEFDFNEYLRVKAEEEDLEKAVAEQLEGEKSLAEWNSLSNEEKEELRLNSQTENKENK